MSDYLLKLIPKNPQYIPSTDLQRNSKAFLQSIFNNGIELRATENIEFIDCGENFEEVICPNCNHPLDMGWWGQIMSSMYENHFEQPNIILPCCNKTYKIFDLHYKLDCGFSKFIIKIFNPDKELSQQQLSKLEKIINCELRVIRAHY